MQTDEYQTFVASKMTEAAFQAQVLQVARTLGWRCYHTAISYGSAGGFPDLVMVRQPRLIFAELKRQSAKSQPTPAQQEWLDDLAAVGRVIALGLGHGPAPEHYGGVEAYLWRPIDITTDTILEVLR